ncbi:MAG TPA: hypothetical protein VE172_11675 [Stackebrandtia sp.]|jgi:hypothetical protein|uniref:hypothetical protein n=1 Tax=Stackebrandtia sp. TaxID=2023065 RepID=UPI002D64FE8B|nr:hypothetical protein [Stackebrandtia sp.]HZE39457.1 hypothetical protein [Stackebrandtia sp.]
MSTDTEWVPDACTLPTAEQPLRIAAFGDLFAHHLRDGERLSPTRLRLAFDPDARAELENLLAAESDCCSFFGFTIGDDAGDLRLDIDVPASQTTVLDGLAAQAGITA